MNISNNCITVADPYDEENPKIYTVTDDQPKEQVRRKVKKNEVPDFKCHGVLKVAKQDSDEKGRFIEGYASTIDIDRTNDVVHPSAFKNTLKKFMENPVVTFMHDFEKVIGKVVESKIDEKGFWVRAKIAEGVQAIDETWALIEQGMLKAFSFSFKINEQEEVKDGDTIVRHIKGLETLEVAVVSIPMNHEARFSIAKGLAYGDDLVQLSVNGNYSKHSEDYCKKHYADESCNTCKTKTLHEPAIFTAKDGEIVPLVKPKSELKDLEGISSITNNQSFKLFWKDRGIGVTLTHPDYNEEEGMEKEKCKCKEPEEKAGRVLSGKNRKTLSNSVESLISIATSLKTLLEETQEDQNIANDKDEDPKVNTETDEKQAIDLDVIGAAIAEIAGTINNDLQKKVSITEKLATLH